MASRKVCVEQFMPTTSGSSLTIRPTSSSRLNPSQKASTTATSSFRAAFKLEAMYKRPSGGHFSVVFPGGWTVTA